MAQRIGVLLLEKSEIIIRIYEATEQEWSLLHYQCMQIQMSAALQEIEPSMIIEAIAEFLITDPAQHVNEWKMGARSFPYPMLQKISLAIGLPIENMTHLREQELLCKGMFTELW